MGADGAIQRPHSAKPAKWLRRVNGVTKWVPELWRQGQRCGDGGGGISMAGFFLISGARMIT